MIFTFASFRTVREDFIQDVINRVERAGGAALSGPPQLRVLKSYSGGFRNHLAPTSCNQQSIYAIQ